MARLIYATTGDPVPDGIWVVQVSDAGKTLRLFAGVISAEIGVEGGVPAVDAILLETGEPLANETGGPVAKE